jgi:hypothetical protein
LKVQFEFSAGDLAEVASRAADRSRVVQGWRWQGRMTWSVLVSLLVYVVTPGQPTGRAVIAGLVCLLLVVVVPRLSASSRKSQMLRYYREQLGGDGPFVCEVELSPAGLITRQLGVETTHPWSQVASATEVSPGGIEFIYRPMGALLVRDRAFPTKEGREQFLALALRLIPRGDAN